MPPQLSSPHDGEREALLRRPMRAVMSPPVRYDVPGGRLSSQATKASQEGRQRRQSRPGWEGGVEIMALGFHTCGERTGFWV